MPGPSDPSPPWAPAPEVRRRRREGWIIAGIIVAVTLLAIAQFRLPQSLGSGSLGTDAILIGLINVNLILLVLLVFLVGRNIAKLIFEQRRRIMGAHLRTRLVVAFVAIALLPATLLFLVGLVFVGNSIERWFNGQVERALEGALEVAHDYYQDLAGTALGFAQELAQQVGQQGFLGRDRREPLKGFLDARRTEYQLDVSEVCGHGQALGRSRREDLPTGIGAEPSAELIQRATKDGKATVIDRVGEADVIRAAVPIQDEGKTVGVVVVDSYVPFSVVVRRDESERAFNTAGVVSADAEGRVTTMNRAAEGLLGMSAAASVGRRIDEVFAGDGYADVGQLAAELRASVPVPGLPLGSNGAASAPVERQLKLAREGCEVAVLLTGTRLMTENVGARGLVLFLEDVSHLLRVQRMEAWREVARRIAHEIKNPLTPIQLSAQRLRRRYGAELREGGAVFDECTRTIIQQVEELKALVYEFATFARMPAGPQPPQVLIRLDVEAWVHFS